MLLIFRARDIRKQIMHARSAPEHRALPDGRVAPEASLYLTKQGERIYLLSSGIPESSQPAYAIGHEPGASCAADDDDPNDDRIDGADFGESIALDAFTKALALPEVTIVLRSTYLNVLGGQPPRRPAVSFAHAQRRR